MRDTRFNPARAEWRAASVGAAGYPVALATMLIYSNRTGYNGLFRLNRQEASMSFEHTLARVRDGSSPPEHRKILCTGPAVARWCATARSVTLSEIY